MTTLAAPKIAILNGVKTDRKNIVAVCEWATYDVWGNAKDGYEVNDVYRQGEIEIPATVEVSNMPRLPGASDRYRSFPASFSFNCEMLVSFTLDDKDIRKALEIRCKFEVDGDDQNMTVNRARDGYPLCEIRILRYEERD